MGGRRPRSGIDKPRSGEVEMALCRSAHRLFALTAAAAALMSASSARASFITDTAFFNTLPTTLITFEADGAGNPITLIQGQRLAMPSNAYATQGVNFSGTNLSWVNDGNSAFDAAQLLEGSAVTPIPSSLCNQFTLTFNVPVQAFAFFVANNRTADPTGPTMVARDINGNILDTATWGAKFIDGTITSPNTTA